MTPKDYAQQQTGTVIKLPAGTVIGHDHWYQENGEWTTTPAHWTSDMPREWRPRTLQVDQFFEVKIDAGMITSQCLKASKNASNKSVDGPLTIKQVTGLRRT